MTRIFVPIAVRRAVTTALALALALSLTAAVPAPLEAAPVFRDKALTTKPNPGITITGGGWGHSVGMSQYGAYAMAQAGHSAAQILRHYYRGITVAADTMPNRLRVGLHKTMEASDVDAVTGDVPWITCDDSGCTRVRLQPKGTTWRVRLLADGDYALVHDGVRQWKGGSGKRLIANFNPRAAENGTVIRAFNPNGARRQYKWGRMEYSVNSPTNRTMFMVLDIPSMELYLRGLGEVPNSWGVKGHAALQAQAITGRTYALGMHRAFNGNRADCRCSLLATPANQAYTGYEKETAEYGTYWIKAVDDTAAQVAAHDGKLISTYYSSSHGGRSENSEDSWAYSASLPYLRSVDDSWSLAPTSGNPLSTWSTTVGNGAFAKFVGQGVSQVRAVSISGRTDGGSPKVLNVAGVDANGNPVTVTRTGKKGIVGIDLRSAFSFSGRVNLSTLPSQQVRKLTFGPFDDDDGNVHEYSIIYAAAAGIMPGVSATKFNPTGAVTRADMAAFLYRTFDLPKPTRDHFDDDNGLPEEEAINAVAEAGIAKGVARRQFAPGRVLNRMQMATFFYAALGLSRVATDHFDDDNGLVHETSINAIASKGIVGGCATRKFCPKQRIRRAQMATFLYQTVEAYR
jgi:SpoIID/LytB domain protein